VAGGFTTVGPSAHRRADLLGALLAAAFAAWILMGSLATVGSPTGLLSVAAGAMFAFILGRLLGKRHPRVAIAAVVVVGVIVAAWSIPDIMRDRPLGRPFAYDNATAAFFVQAAAAGWMLSLRARGTAVVVVAGILTAGFALVPFLVDSLAGEVLVLAVLSLGAVGRFGLARPMLIAGLVATAFVSVMVATIVLGATYRPGEAPPSDVLRSTLSERRLALWHDGLLIVRGTPLFGIGVTRFSEVSEVARSDPDTRQAHNEFLQIAAEAGVVAGVLLVAVFVWAIVRPAVEIGPGRRTWAVIGSAAVGAVAIHACVDYVFHTAAVPIATAYLSGIATAGGREDIGSIR
jgi:O-antigen ligase